MPSLAVTTRRAGARPPGALWAGPGARRALAAGVAGEVEYALHPGGYAQLGSEWVLLAIPRAPRGPLTLLVAGLEEAPLRVGEALVREGDELRAGSLRIDLSGLARAAPGLVVGAAPVGVLGAAPVRPVAPMSDLTGAPTRLAALPLPGWHAALTAALDVAPAPPPALAAGLDALRAGHEVAAVAALAGRGEGLTPAGDDALAGYAAWCHAEGRHTAVAQLAASRAAPLGLAYLGCALRGELPEPAEAVLRAVRAGDVLAATRRARGLSRWGASSGAALLWGIAAGAGA